MPFRLRLRSGRALCSLVSLCALAACGGGSETSAPVSQTPSFAAAESFAANVFLINPAATWRPLLSADDGFRGPVAVIDLSPLLSSGATLAGAQLSVQALGSYNATPSAIATQLINNVSAVFVDSAGRTVAKGISNSALPDARVYDCSGSTTGSDPFEGDFRIPADAPALLVIPPGAFQLRVSVDDCYFLDNVSTPADPVRLSMRPAAS